MMTNSRSNLLNLHVWGIGTIQNLEAVVKQALRLVVGDQDFLHGSEEIRLVVVALPYHTQW